MIEKRIGRAEAASCFPPLADRVNKGDMGRVLVVCGSYDPSGLSMCGAAYFAAKAAYLCGAGIVEIFTPRENYTALASLVPEAVFSLYGYDEKCDSVSSRLAESVKKSDSVVLGCGLGKSDMSKALVRAVFECVESPMIVDADALNILSEQSELWSLLSEKQRKRTVITPHPGEMARLNGMSISEIVSAVAQVSVAFASERGVICLLKDHNTAVSDGETVYINRSGNSGMATAGMGDVLAGIIGALLARITKKDEILLTVAASAYLHGFAGDLAADRLGQYSLSSSELLMEIPAAITILFG